jgi:predicted PurR-regulated permease PerM
MDEQSQQEMYRLTRENNKMLHAMRRNALWGGLLKFVLYAVFLLLPLWFYMTYLNSTVQKLLQTYQQVQGTGAQVQTQVNGWEQAWQDFESKFGFGPSKTSQ